MKFFLPLFPFYRKKADSHSKASYPNFGYPLFNRTIILISLLLSAQAFGQQVDTWFWAGKAVNADPSGFNFYDPQPGVPGTFANPGGDGTSVFTWYDIVDFVTQDAVPHPPVADYPLPYPAGFDYPYGSPSFLTPAGSTPGQPTFRRNITDNINFNPVVQFDGSGNGQALHFRSNSRDDVTVFVVFRAQGAGNTAETQRLLFGGDVDTHHTSGNINSWTTNLSLGIADNNRFSIGRTWAFDGGGYFQSGNIDLLGAPTIGVFTRQTAVDQERLTTHVNGLTDISTVRNHFLADNSLFFFNRLGKHFNSNDSNRNLTGDIAEVLLADTSLSSSYLQRVESYLAVKYGITLFDGVQLGSIVGNDTYNYLAANGDIIWQAEAVYKHDIAGIGTDRFDNGGITRLRYHLDQRISKSENSDAIVTISTNTNFSTDNLDLTRTVIDGGPPSYNYNYLLWGNDDGSINEIFAELPTGITSRLEREWRVQSNQLGGVSPISGVSVRVDLSGSDIIANGTCGIKLLIDTDGDGDFTTGIITSVDATSVDINDNAYFDGIDFQDRDVFTVGYGDTTPPTASNPLPISTCDVIPAPDPTVVTDEADNCGIPTVAWVSDVSDGLSNPETITRTYSVTDDAGNSINVQQIITVYTSPVVNAGSDEEICEGDDLDLSVSMIPPTIANAVGLLWTTSGDGVFNDNTTIHPIYTPGANDIINGMVTLTLTGNGNGSCPDVVDDMALTISNTPLADAPADVESCDSYILPALANGNYFDAPNGGGNALLAGDPVTTTTTIYVFSPGTGSCPDVENSFLVTINILDISISVQNETCWESMDGFANVTVNNASMPLTVQLDSAQPMIFPNSTFTIDGLSPGYHALTIIDNNGCQTQTNFEILPGGPNLSASVEPIYSCISGMPSNSIEVTLTDSTIDNEVLYALDSTNPDDFIISPNFEDISPGNHSLSIMHTNGCLIEIPFVIENVEPLNLTLSSDNINEITANVTGGSAPYSYYFDNNPGTNSNTYTINRSGTFVVRVIDSNGCETLESITMNLADISIPNFFTPNNDGQNDYWRPRNMELFPNIQTYIFDRYGRKIKIMGPLDAGWDGYYESKPLPSGDYWYIVALNDGSGREYVGHFTLYR